jgi:hypothetical protein
MSKRSIGFSALVDIEAHTLFDIDDFGIVNSGVQATKVDLDVPDVQNEQVKASLLYFIWSCQASGTNDLLAVIAFECPGWFEPVKRRLALNDLAWSDCTKPVNNIDDFDPWSKSVLLAHYRANVGLCGELGPQTAISGCAERGLPQVSD